MFTLAGVCFYKQNLMLLMALIFLLGMQAALFGPLKYSILPQHLSAHELIAANALIETGTYIAILLGSILGGLLITAVHGTIIITLCMVALAGFGLYSSYKIPFAQPADPYLKLNANVFKESWNMIQYASQNKDVYLAILGISWFWALGFVYLSQFPSFTFTVLHAAVGVANILFIAFTVGIALGSLACNRLLRGSVHATYVPLAALGISIFALDLVFASKHVIHLTENLQTASQFFKLVVSWRILIDVFLVALCSGVYIVPLYAIIQQETPVSHLSRVVAANNILNAIFMVVASIIPSIMFAIGFSTMNVFLVAALANLIVALYVCKLWPGEFIQSALIWIFTTLFRVEVRGLENYHTAGRRTVIVSNHTSLLDAALLAAFLPDKLTFAIDTFHAKKWWLKWMLKLVQTYSVDPTNPIAIKSLIDYLKSDKRLVIFPEGRITVTGGLMKIHETPGLIADRANATILPIRIEGAQYSPFSYLRGKVKIRWFPKIVITILEPKTIDFPESMSSRDRRQKIGSMLFDLMTETIYTSSDIHEPLFQTLLNATALHGKKHIILEDIERQPMTYGRLLLGSIILGQRIAKHTQPGEYVGVLLPNSIANVVTFFWDASTSPYSRYVKLQCRQS